MLCKNVFGISFFRKDSMKVNMDSLKNPTFSNIFPRAKHVQMTFEF